MQESKVANYSIFALCIFNVLVHLVFFGNLEYHRDELLYYSIGIHPQFGYASIPPLTGWIAFIFQSITGFSLFGVKLYPALLSGVFTYLSILISREIGGQKYAQILTGIAVILMPVSLRTFHLFQPVCTDLFLWTLIIYYSIRFVNTDKSKYLIYIGVAGGFAMLNKYLVFLLLFSFLIAILFSEHRKIYSNKYFYFGLLCCTLIFSPNLIWQIINGMPVFGHMSELNEQQLVNVNRLDFILDQFLMTFSASILMLLGFVYLLKNENYRYLALTSFLVVLILFIVRGKSYYTIGVIPVLVASGAVGIERMMSSNFLRILLPLVMLVITIPFLPLGIPTFKQAGMVQYFQKLEDNFGLTLGRRFEDGTIHSLPQDYADQIGWEELTQLTANAYNSVKDKNKTLIYGENYGQAGAIAVIGKKYNLPEPASFSDSFIYWVPKKFKQEIESFIYINDEIGDDVKGVFQEIEIVGQISNPNAREYGTTVYLCTQPKSSFSEFWSLVLEETLNE